MPNGSKEKELIIGTNNEEVLIALAKDKTLKTTYLRITYKKNKVLPRDLSPLKPVLVEGVWDRVRSRLVPSEAGGASR